jgi:hypothetical protein
MLKEGNFFFEFFPAVGEQSPHARNIEGERKEGKKGKNILKQ